MDCRIDPETDNSLCAHSATCEACHESLMAFSMLHTNHLQDSDSMKIKLENLGLHEVFARRRPLPRRNNRWFAVVASVAAMLIVCLGVLCSDWGAELLNPEKPTAVVMVAGPSDEQSSRLTLVSGLDKVSLSSLVRVHENLGHHDLYQYSTDLPGLRPLKALTYCLSWVQDSWFGELSAVDSESVNRNDVFERADFNGLESTSHEYAFINVLCL